MSPYRSAAIPSGPEISRMRKKAKEAPPPKPKPVRPPKTKPVITERSCTTCKVVFPMAEFLTKNGRSRYTRCPACRRKIAKEAMRKRHKYDTIYVREYLIGTMGGRCIRCGYDEFSGSLEFHHVDPSRKEDRMSRLINQFAYGGTAEQWQVVVSEALKCAILCSNCHQALHQRAWTGIGALLTKIARPTHIQMPPLVEK